MLEINKRILLFKIKEIWFSDSIFDVDNVHKLIFRSCRQEIDKPEFQKENFTTLMIDLNKNLELIWQEMDKSSCRYSIHRAEQDGIKVVVNENFEEFYKIYKKFNKSKGLPVSRWNPNDMKKYGTLFTAVSNNKIIAGNLYLEDEKKIRWLLGASQRLNDISKEKKIIIGNANRLLIWEAIKYAKEKVIQEFDFGGYYIGQNPDKQKEGINSFKKSFGGELKTYYNYQKDYSLFFKVLYSVHKFLQKRNN